MYSIYLIMLCLILFFLLSIFTLIFFFLCCLVNFISLQFIVLQMILFEMFISPCSIAISRINLGCKQFHFTNIFYINKRIFFCKSFINCCFGEFMFSLIKVVFGKQIN